MGTKFSTAKVLCYAVLHERKFVFVGLSEEELMAELETLKSADVDPHSGKLFAYSYHSEGDKLEVVKKFYDKFEEQLPITPAKERIVQTFFSAFMQENALNPLVFPSLRFVFSSSVVFTSWVYHSLIMPLLSNYSKCFYYFYCQFWPLMAIFKIICFAYNSSSIHTNTHTHTFIRVLINMHG